MDSIHAEADMRHLRPEKVSRTEERTSLGARAELRGNNVLVFPGEQLYGKTIELQLKVFSDGFKNVGDRLKGKIAAGTVMYTFPGDISNENMYVQMEAGGDTYDIKIESSICSFCFDTGTVHKFCENEEVPFLINVCNSCLVSDTEGKISCSRGGDTHVCNWVVRPPQRQRGLFIGTKNMQNGMGTGDMADALTQSGRFDMGHGFMERCRDGFGLEWTDGHTMIISMKSPGYAQRVANSKKYRAYNLDVGGSTTRGQPGHAQGPGVVAVSVGPTAMETWEFNPEVEGWTTTNLNPIQRVVCSVKNLLQALSEDKVLETGAFFDKHGVRQYGTIENHLNNLGLQLDEEYPTVDVCSMKNDRPVKLTYVFVMDDESSTMLAFGCEGAIDTGGEHMPGVTAYKTTAGYAGSPSVAQYTGVGAPKHMPCYTQRPPDGNFPAHPYTSTEEIPQLVWGKSGFYDLETDAGEFYSILATDIPGLEASVNFGWDHNGMVDKAHSYLLQRGHIQPPGALGEQNPHAVVPCFTMDMVNVDIKTNQDKCTKQVCAAFRNLRDKEVVLGCVVVTVIEDLVTKSMIHVTTHEKAESLEITKCGDGRFQPVENITGGKNQWISCDTEQCAEGVWGRIRYIERRCYVVYYDKEPLADSGGKFRGVCAFLIKCIKV